jgi:hypothetical protein
MAAFSSDGRREALIASLNKQFVPSNRELRLKQLDGAVMRIIQSEMPDASREKAKAISTRVCIAANRFF